MTTKKARTAASPAQGVDIDDQGNARVWSSMEFTVRLHEYESVKVSFGQSQPCENDRDVINDLKKEQLKDTEQLMARKVTRLRKIWRDL